MRLKKFVESLESRLFLSVSGATLAFPLTVGGQWTTTDLEDGATDSLKITRSTSYGGRPATTIQDVFNAPDNPTQTSTEIFGFDGAKNFVVYSSETSSTDNSVDPPVTTTTNETYAPGFVLYPTTMVGGQTYTSTSQLHGVTVETPGKTTTGDVTVTSKVKLLSETKQKITVPAGTFMCYELSISDTYVSPKNTITLTSTNWIAPGVYPVKTINGTGANLTTTVLTTVGPSRKVPTQLEFGTQPSDVQAGKAISPPVIVDVEDVHGGLVTDNTSTVTLAVATGPSGGTMTGTLSVAAQGGEASFSNLKFSVPGKYTLRATDGSLPAVVSQVFTVSAGATKLNFGVQPSPAVAGKKIAPPVTVEIDNSDGTIDTTNTSSVTLSIDSGPFGGSLGGTVTVAAVGGIAMFSDLTLNIPGLYTLKAVDGSLTSAISTGFSIISPAKASKLAFAVQPGQTIAGKVIAPAVTVAVEYPGGAIVLTDTSTITLSIASGPGTLGGTLTAQAVNGIASFSSLLLTKAGQYTLKAVDGTLTAATSNTFKIIPATATKLAFAATPPTTLAGKPITPAVAVYIEDTFGNIATSNTSGVSIAIATGGGTLGGTKTIAATAGIATFANLSLTKVGTYTLKATDAALTAATSASFKIIPAVAVKLVLVNSPATTVAGTAIAPALVVDIEDAFGNIVTTNTSNVTLAVATGGGTLTGTTTVAARAGVATLSNLILTKVGTYTLKAVDGLLTSATTRSFSVTPAAAAKLVFAAAPATTSAGKAISPAVVVDIEDKFGNIVTGNTSNVTISLLNGPAGGVLGGTLLVAAKAGVATFSKLLLTKAGSYTLKAVDSLLTAATSASFKVIPAAAARVVFTKLPTTGAVGAVLAPSIAVAVEDAFGNIITTNTSKVTLALATGPAGAAINGTLLQSAVAGVATFDNLKPSKAGTYTLKVADGSLTPAVSATITVS